MPNSKTRSRPADASQRACDAGKPGAGLGAAGWRRGWSLVLRLFSIAVLHLGRFVMCGLRCVLRCVVPCCACYVACVCCGVSCAMLCAAASASALSHAIPCSDGSLAACPPCPMLCLLPRGGVRSAVCCGTTARCGAFLPAAGRGRKGRGRSTPVTGVGPCLCSPIIRVCL